MPCPHCASADKLFNDKQARRDLKAYRKKGPSGSTTLLLVVRPRLREGGAVLDVGGGIGAIQHDLAEAGASRLHGVDASHGYLAVARSEADRLGYGDRSTQQYGDLVEIEADVPEADVVTLDRVLCCYPDLDALLGVAARKSRRVVGVVFPKERWWSRMGVVVLNAGIALTGSAYRAYVHAEERVDRVAEQEGFVRVSAQSTWLWNVWVYERAA